MKRVLIVAVVLWLAVFSGMIAAADFNFNQIKNRVTTFTLENGLKFILLEDHSIPIVRFVTYVNVGGVDERIGIYGISHFLEHLAFKGTEEIGSKNFKAEKKIMDKMDAVFERILVEKNRINPDLQAIKQWETELESLKEEATKYVVSNEIETILKKEGSVGLNAATSKDYTMYLLSLPSNKIELWAYLESSRFTKPVFREFYKEREVIREERRVLRENTPIGKLIEELQGLAFKDHPYRISLAGPMSNIENITRPDAREYFRTHYTASNMVIGVAGDVTPGHLKKLAQKYFSKLPAGKRNPLLFTVEPPQGGEKTITMYEESQPWLVIAYHCPSSRHEDFVKFDVLNYILTYGRSSRLYKKMVISDKTALNIASLTGFPGNKYPTLYLILALPNSGRTTTEMEETIMAEIESLKKEPVSEEELQSAKIRSKMSTLKAMKSPIQALAGMLKAEVVLGSWEKAYDEITAIDKITTRDIQDLVNRYFTRNSRVIARIEKKEEVSK